VAYHVYLLASRKHGTLYVGVTNNLARRVHEHRRAASPGFTATYGVTRLVWYESYTYVVEAIDREKALKKWRHDWEIRLIEDFNPDWSDLSPTLSGWTGS